MRSFKGISSAMEEVEDFLSRGRGTFKRQLFVLVDPVPRDGDRRNLSIASESTDFAHYKGLWDCGNPNSAWALDGGVVWVRRRRDTHPVNDSTSN